MAAVREELHGCPALVLLILGMAGPLLADEPGEGLGLWLGQDRGSESQPGVCGDRPLWEAVSRHG